MKKWWIFLLLPVLLTGCAAEPVFEQVQDVYAGTDPIPAEILMVLPEEASVRTGVQGDAGQLYFCDGYTLTTQTLAGGDLGRSLREMTGYGPEDLTVLETDRGGVRCVTCAWTSAGEGGDQVGRLVLLDDRTYHYVVTVMAPADRAGDLRDTWDSLLNQVTLTHTGS